MLGRMGEPGISLEPLRPEHAEDIFASLSDPDAYRFISDEPPGSVEELRERYSRQVVGYSTDRREVWCNWIIRDDRSLEALGYTQATIKDRSALLGYHLAPRFWQRGIGARAVDKTIRLIFERGDVDRVIALVDTRNAASVALLKRHGFALVAHHAKADFFKGENSDEFEFELTRAAWDVPTIPYEGDIADTPALEAWVPAHALPR